MAQLDALRNAGGAAGVQENEAVVRFRRRHGGLSFREEGNLPGGKDGPLVTGHERFQARIGDEQRGLRVLHHEGKAFGRVGRIQGLIGAPGLEDGQRGDAHVFVAADDDGHHAAGFHDAFDVRGEPVRELVELGIGEQRALVGDGEVVGMGGDVFPEQVDEGLVQVEVDGPRVEAFHLGHLLVRCEDEVLHGLRFLQGMEAGGETVRELLQNAFGILLGPIEDGHLVFRPAEEGVDPVREFLRRLFRGTLQAHGTVQFQLGRTVGVRVCAVLVCAMLARAFRLFCHAVEEFLRRLVRRPFQIDGAFRRLAVGEAEAGLRVAGPYGQGQSERRGDLEVLVLARGKGEADFPGRSFLTVQHVGNQTGFQLRRLGEGVDEPLTVLFECRFGCAHLFYHFLYCTLVWHKRARSLPQKPIWNAMFEALITLALAAVAIWLLVDSAVEFTQESQDDSLATQH